MELKVRRLDGDRDPELAFERLYGTCGEAFWLDSSRVGEGARFSFFGAPGPHGASITYELATGAVRVRRGEEVETREESIFAYLAAELERLRGPVTELPFGFNCGFVGYFGYELKAECGGRAAHAATVPDAAFLFV
ncbi:MAG: aminodeoxychorismate synthase component I, partial [Solirubrobacterales bacterium]